MVVKLETLFSKLVLLAKCGAVALIVVDVVPDWLVEFRAGTVRAMLVLMAPTSGKVVTAAVVFVTSPINAVIDVVPAEVGIVVDEGLSSPSEAERSTVTMLVKCELSSTEVDVSTCVDRSISVVFVDTSAVL